MSPEELSAMFLSVTRGEKHVGAEYTEEQWAEAQAYLDQAYGGTPTASQPWTQEEIAIELARQARERPIALPEKSAPKRTLPPKKGTAE